MLADDAPVFLPRGVKPTSASMGRPVSGSPIAEPESVTHRKMSIVDFESVNDDRGSGKADGGTSV